jgi:hypothetical protein
MSFFNAKNIIESTFSKPKNDASKKTQKPEDIEKINSALDGSSYKLKSDNWYSTKPYGFKFSREESGQDVDMVMFLPIGPNNLNIGTSFATNTVATLLGTVEEHSPVRYFNISIEGTTGTAPKYVMPGYGNAAQVYDTLKSSPYGRSSFSVAEGLSAGGFFPKTFDLINKTLDKAADLFDGGPSTKVGFTDAMSGYAAFHNLYRFLLLYKNSMSSKGNSKPKKPLIFFNYKDNNEYYVTINNFTLRRSAENPTLYYYSIQMRGYDLRTAGESKDIEESLADRISQLGLDGVKTGSIFGEIKNISSGVKSIVGAASGAIGAFGR